LFDLRYHVASLAAVFLALIIGILVGAGLASRTDVEGSERRVLQDRIEELEQRNDDLVAQADLLRRQREAGEDYVANTYLPLMNGRLRGKRVALLFTGQPDDADASRRSGCSGCGRRARGVRASDQRAGHGRLIRVLRTTMEAACGWAGSSRRGDFIQMCRPVLSRSLR
jgi:hypothetical protein